MLEGFNLFDSHDIDRGVDDRNVVNIQLDNGNSRYYLLQTHVIVDSCDSHTICSQLDRFEFWKSICVRGFWFNQ